MDASEQDGGANASRRTSAVGCRCARLQRTSSRWSAVSAGERSDMGPARARTSAPVAISASRRSERPSIERHPRDERGGEAPNGGRCTDNPSRSPPNGTGRSTADHGLPCGTPTTRSIALGQIASRVRAGANRRTARSRWSTGHARTYTAMPRALRREDTRVGARPDPRTRVVVLGGLHCME